MTRSSVPGAVYILISLSGTRSKSPSASISIPSSVSVALRSKRWIAWVSPNCPQGSGANLLSHAVSPNPSPRAANKILCRTAKCWSSQWMLQGTRVTQCWPTAVLSKPLSRGLALPSPNLAPLRPRSVSLRNPCDCAGQCPGRKWVVPLTIGQVRPCIIRRSYRLQASLALSGAPWTGISSCFQCSAAVRKPQAVSVSQLIVRSALTGWGISRSRARIDNFMPSAAKRRVRLKFSTRCDVFPISARKSPQDVPPTVMRYSSSACSSDSRAELANPNRRRLGATTVFRRNPLADRSLSMIGFRVRPSFSMIRRTSPCSGECGPDTVPSATGHPVFSSMRVRRMSIG
jgi:hypothetical protein